MAGVCITQVFTQFAVGLFSILAGVIFGAWLRMPPYPATATTIAVLYGMAEIVRTGRKHWTSFSFDNDTSVSFDDLLLSFAPGAALMPFPLHDRDRP